MTRARREVLLGGAGIALLACARNNAAKAPSAKGGEEEDVSPAEDLMREHGALNRILLVYDESVRRLGGAGEAPLDVITAGASLIRRFIEGYHEKLEEDFLFPRFEKANVHVALVATLRRQHEAGRRVTETILRLASASSADATARQHLAEQLQLFARMYRPHEAREDTVLFPSLPKVISEKELEELGERFEEKEHQLFGKDGFEGVVGEVASLEKKLGIHELDQFTPG